jgi:hypothetical protein
VFTNVLLLFTGRFIASTLENILIAFSILCVDIGGEEISYRDVIGSSNLRIQSGNHGQLIDHFETSRGERVR